MAAVVRGSCTECGAIFYLKEGEILLLPTMTPRRHPPTVPYLETWADWVYHVSNYCPEHRIVQPPPDCVADLQYHMALNREDVEESD